jgi:hypothetical protein
MLRDCWRLLGSKQDAKERRRKGFGHRLKGESQSNLRAFVPLCLPRQGRAMLRPKNGGFFRKHVLSAAEG